MLSEPHMLVLNKQYRRSRMLCLDLRNWTILPYTVKGQEVSVVCKVVLYSGSCLETFSLLVCAARLHN